MSFFKTLIIGLVTWISIRSISYQKEPVCIGVCAFKHPCWYSSQALSWL